MASHISRAPPSIAEGSGLAAGVLCLIDRVDELPVAATGYFEFGEGVVLVQDRKICWAATRTLRPRLSLALRYQHEPPVPREALAAVLRSCRTSGRPLGDALVRSGIVSVAGLRGALLEHTQSALIELARTNVRPARFVPHAGEGYDARFWFSGPELLAGVGASLHSLRAAAATREIEAAIVPDSSVAAFVRPPGRCGALLLAVDRACGLPARSLMEACNYATGLLDVARTVDPTSWVARAVLCSRTALVAWQTAEIGFIGLCSSRAATARLMNWIERRAGPTAPSRPAARGAGT